MFHTTIPSPQTTTTDEMLIRVESRTLVLKMMNENDSDRTLQCSEEILFRESIWDHRQWVLRFTAKGKTNFVPMIIAIICRTLGNIFKCRLIAEHFRAVKRSLKSRRQSRQQGLCASFITFKRLRHATNKITIEHFQMFTTFSPPPHPFWRKNPWNVEKYSKHSPLILNHLPRKCLFIFSLRSRMNIRKQFIS